MLTLSFGYQGALVCRPTMKNIETKEIQNTLLEEKSSIGNIVKFWSQVLWSN